MQIILLFAVLAVFLGFFFEIPSKTADSVFSLFCSLACLYFHIQQRRCMLAVQHVCICLHSTLYCICWWEVSPMRSGQVKFRAQRSAAMHEAHHRFPALN